MSEIDGGSQSADDLYHSALEYMYSKPEREKDQKNVARLLYLAAQAGHIKAQSTLAGLYEKGDGVAKDEQRALELYSQAAEGGDGHSMLMLGYAYRLHGKLGVAPNAEMSAWWFLRAAQAGEKSAFEHVSECYLRGRGLAKNEEAAFFWKKSLADTGDVQTCLELAAIAQENGEYLLAYELLFRASKNPSSDLNRVSEINKSILDVVGFLTSEERKAVRNDVNGSS
jgi:TPR repeat protein